MKIDPVLDLSFIVFKEFTKKWGITFHQLGDLIERYQLITFLKNNITEANEFGVGGILEYMIEPYIISKGGSIDYGKVK